MPRVEYTKRGHLVAITLDRPERLNAIDAAMQDDLAAAWRRYDADDDAWLAIITGRGRAFCAGADTSWFKAMQRGDDSLGRFLEGIDRDPYWSGAIDKPSIAAIDGLAVGAGVDLALRADLRVAGAGASFRLPEVDLGSFQLLWENLPYALAAEMLTGAAIDAPRAHQVGLVNRLAPAGDALDAATAWAEELLAKPPLVLAGALKALRGIRNANAVPSARWLRARSTELSRQWAGSDDVREAVTARLEKRRATYRRR
ncbi:MAG: enoyl-CoA hydratase/isomerase family protein [Burkholderiaceae bacterium]|nr:enoyl-CoA hydratase/isomerase family protein [Burkholderiaceae bacterium]